MGLSRAAKWRFWGQIPLFLLLWAVILFATAGKLHWVRGWIYVTSFALAMIVGGAVTLIRNPALIEARANWRHADTKPFDRVFLRLLLPLILSQLVVAGLDERFRWSCISFHWIYPGAILFMLAIGLMASALVVNPFAEPTVRIQTERGHSVISSGPYRFVRHPMYSGALLTHIATPLILGSAWALVVTGLIVVFFVARTSLEDRTLRAELPGYTDYASRTKHRLLPFIW